MFQVGNTVRVLDGRSGVVTDVDDENRTLIVRFEAVSIRALLPNVPEERYPFEQVTIVDT